MTLKIERIQIGNLVRFSLSGRIRSDQVALLQNLIEQESAIQEVGLDLHEIRLVDGEAVRFLAGCEAKGIRLEKCPAYIRAWIAREEK